MRSRLRTLEHLGKTVRAFFQKHWQRALRIRERLRFSEEAVNLLLAGGVGVIGGLINLVFYLCIEAVTAFFLRHTGDPVEVAEILAPWQRVITPMLGGLGAGLVLHWGLRWVGFQGTSNLLEVVVAGDGRLPFRTAIVKAVSSLITIGAGGSIGREGAITQLSATFASKWGQLAQWPPYRLRMLVACGAASGIAAAYNAPVAGAVFAALIVLGNFSMNLFAPLVFASVVSSMVSRSFFGIEPWYDVPSFNFTSIAQLPWFLVLGLLSGVFGAGFLNLLQISERMFQRLALPVYGRLALGGLLVGVIAIVFPGVWGNGYVVTSRILHEDFNRLAEPWLYEAIPGINMALLILAGLFLAKVLATAITVGSGAVGGVFTPTLFVGAALGCAFGTVLHQLGIGEPLPTGAFALIGMGSVLAATTHSPLLAMILGFEISLNYSLMPPLMLACVVSSLVARKLHRDSIYTAPMRFKEFAMDRESERIGAATERTIGDLMHAPVAPLRETATLRQIADRFLTSPNNFLPVVDGNERLLGMVALQDLKGFLTSDHDTKVIIAYDVMRPPPACVTPNQRLIDALPAVLASEQRNVPVVSTLTENRLVGAVVRAEVLGIFSEAIASSNKPKE